VSGPPWDAQASPQPATLDTPAAVLTDQPRDPTPASPSLPPGWWVPPAAPLTWPAPLRQLWRQLAGHGSHRAVHRDDDEDDVNERRGGHRARHRGYDEGDDNERRGRRRWPIVSAALALLVVLVLAGGFGFWRYNQSQYYVGEENGFVAIFRGTNQNLAGISMSSLVQGTTLPVSQLTTSDQAAVAQTISQGNVTGAHQVIETLAAHANSCKLQWQALVLWQGKNARYQAELAAAAKAKAKVPPQDNPGMEPTPADSDCAPAAAFDIAASALPTAQPSAAPSVTPSRTPSARASSTRTPTMSDPHT
jgi:protein phosphatase